MQLAYIAGPYRAKTEYGVKENIDKAEKIALVYWKLGYAVICPHKNTAFFGGAADDSMWLAGDLEMLKRCDVVVMMNTWRSSSGATKELEVAKQLGKSIHYVDDEGNAFMGHHGKG